MATKTDLKTALTAPKLRSGKINLNTVTPDHFRRSYAAAQNGSPGALWAILALFRRIDGHLGGDLQRRISAVTGARTTLTTTDGSDSKKAEAWIDVLKVWRRSINYSRAARELLSASYYGIRIVEWIWGNVKIGNRTLYLPVAWHKLPDDFVYAKKNSDQDKYTSLWVGNLPLEHYAAGKLSLYLHEQPQSYSNIDFTQLGVALAAVRFSIMKYYDYEDWAAFNEVFAMPFRMGKYDPQSPSVEDDIVQLEKAVHEMGTDASGVIPNTGDITFPEVNKVSSVAAYEALKEACNREISSLILSQSITSSSGKFGTYGATVTANGISMDVAREDAANLDEVMNELFRVILTVNGAGVEITQKTSVQEARNKRDEIAVDDNAHRMGLPLSIRHLRTKYDIPAPENDEDSLEPATGGLLGG